MKIKSKVLCLISFVAFGAFAEEITTTRFPDADAVTVDEIEKVKYNSDGTYEQTDERWTKILTERGRRLITQSVTARRRSFSSRRSELTASSA